MIPQILMNFMARIVAGIINAFPGLPDGVAGFLNSMPGSVSAVMQYLGKWDPILPVGAMVTMFGLAVAVWVISLGAAIVRLAVNASTGAGVKA